MMKIEELSAFFRKNCRFRLKNGREVYGVIWKDANGVGAECYFASAHDHRLYELAMRRSSPVNKPVTSQVHRMNISDIIMAEQLVS